MKWLALSFLFFCLVPSVGARRAPAMTRSAEEAKIVLRFQRSIDPKLLSIRFYLTGPFGGVSSFLRSAENQWEYSLDPHYEGQVAKVVKMIFYCPGYGVELIDIPSLNALPDRKIDVQFKPLPVRRIEGRIILSNVQPSQDAKLRVTYLADWGHQYYGIADGPVTMFQVASTTIAADGAFSIEVPDFRQDPIVMRFDSPGDLMFRVQNPTTGNSPFRLERTGYSDQRNTLSIREDAGSLNFIAQPNN